MSLSPIFVLFTLPFLLVRSINRNSITTNLAIYICPLLSFTSHMGTFHFDSQQPYSLETGHNVTQKLRVELTRTDYKHFTLSYLAPPNYSTSFPSGSNWSRYCTIPSLLPLPANAENGFEDGGRLIHVCEVIKIQSRTAWCGIGVGSFMNQQKFTSLTCSSHFSPQYVNVCAGSFFSSVKELSFWLAATERLKLCADVSERNWRAMWLIRRCFSSQEHGFY